MTRPLDSVAPAPPGTTALLDAVRRMLRPLVGLMIRRGIQFPLMVDLLRGLYVEVAARDLLPDPKSRTDSRISLMTGVHRKEIRRQRSLHYREWPQPPVVTIGTQVVAHWLALGEHGPPPPLPRVAGRMSDTNAPSSVPSFEQIVSNVTRDFRPRSLLDEWIGQGLVSLDETDHVHLNTEAFLPVPGSEEQIFFLGRNLADHLAAGTANIQAADAAPFLDRSAHYDRLSPDLARRIEVAARDIAIQALRDINMMAIATIEREETEHPTTNGMVGAARVNVGVFAYRDDAGPTPTA